MPLPTTNSRLTTSDIYPDNIRIAYRYIGVPPTTWMQFVGIGRALGFSPVQGKRLLQSDLLDPVFQQRVRVTASRYRSGDPVTFTASFNALSDFHERRSDYGGERCCNSDTNWLHPDDVTGDSSYILSHLHERIISFESVLDEIAERLATSMDNGRHAQLASIRLAGLELCVDIATCDPHFALRRLGPEFKRRFQRLRGTRYGESARGYGELLHDANLLRGYLAQGEQYKLYEKTNRRNRLECQLTWSRLYRPAPRTTSDGATGAGRRVVPNLSVTEGDAFSGLLCHLASAVLPHMNALLASDIPGCEEHGSVFELISIIAPMFNRSGGASELRRVLQALGRNRRITARMLPSSKLHRLAASGVLERSTRGVYVVAPRYRTAMRILSIADGRWQGE